MLLQFVLAAELGLLRNHGRLHIHRVLSLVGQVRAPVLHLAEVPVIILRHLNQNRCCKIMTTLTWFKQKCVNSMIMVSLGESLSDRSLTKSAGCTPMHPLPALVEMHVFGPF